MEFANRAIRRLTLLTWNVWFDRLKQTERFLHILNFVGARSVDIVCFQEVTQEFIALLRTQPWKDEYMISDNLTGSTIGRYGVLMLCKRELAPRYSWSAFPTNMGRALLSANLDSSILGSEFTVGTAHFESLDSAEFRHQQLEISQRALHPAAHAVLCGDFNFCSYTTYGHDSGDQPADSPENRSMHRVLHDYIDVWAALVPCPIDTSVVTTKYYKHMSAEEGAQLGLTFDSVRNPVIRQHERMRYDRIMFKSPQTVTDPPSGTAEGGPPDPGTIWKPVSIQLVGTEAIAGFPTVFPSDHFGLLAEFEVV